MHGYETVVTVTALLVISAALYGWGLLRLRRIARPFPRLAPACFALATERNRRRAGWGRSNGLADASLSWHMVQHLALISLAAPLLLLGAPLRLALAALPPRSAAALARVLGSAPFRFLANPLFALLQLTAVLYAAHYSPLYEAALENESGPRRRTCAVPDLGADLLVLRAGRRARHRTRPRTRCGS